LIFDEFNSNNLNYIRDQSKGGAVPQYLMNRPQITEKDLEGKTEEEQEMMKMMGFGGFDTTKVQ